MLTILFENTTKHYAGVDELSTDKLCIVKYEKPRVRAKQIVVEDLGYSRETVLKTESIKYIYSLAETYTHRFDLRDREYVFIVDGSSGFDLGFSLYLLNKLFNRVNQPTVLFIVEIPRLDSGIDVKARFVAWLKTVFLYDIVINSTSNMKIVLTDPNPPFQLIKYLIIILTSNLLLEQRSLLHIKLRRFVTPITELYFLTQLFTLHGKLNYLVEDYKHVLLLMHDVLDRAPTELWSIARKSTGLIQGSIYSLKKIISAREELSKAMSELINLILESNRFSESVIDPRVLLDKLLSGCSIREIHNELFSTDRIMNYLNISRDILIDTYSQGTLSECIYSRFVATGRDLFESIPSGYKTILLENTHSELSVFDTCSVSINSDCKYNTNYIPFNFIDSYFEVSGLSLESLYPREIVFKNTIVKPIDMHNICLVNYSGFIKAVNNECRFSGLKLVKNIIGYSG